MKYAALIVALSIVVFGLWFNNTYTVIKTQVTEEFLVLRTEQAKECAEGGGCNVYSYRERTKELNAFLAYLQSQGYLQKKSSI
jgi:hypothetical protein